VVQPSKSQQRRLAYDARNAQPNKAEVSAKILDRVYRSRCYQEATTVLWYLHCRSEVKTLQAVQSVLLQQDKKIVIPYCTKDADDNPRLGLWHLECLEELVNGTWGILEPPRERWGEAGKEVSPSELDLLITPGVAFDENGGRLGNGAGYYDRLFTQLRLDTHLMAICYKSQLLPQVTMQQYDVYMDSVVTENETYKGKGRE